MSDKSKTNEGGTAGDSKDNEPHKVDQAVQEEAAKERAEDRGYD